MKYTRLHCWDCGKQIINNEPGRGYIPTPELREVRFGLSNGSFMQSPFCLDCATRPWTPERLLEFKIATDRAAGEVRAFEIVRMEVIQPVMQIAGVLS